VTGVLLTFERQIIAWADQLALEEMTTSGAQLPILRLVEAAEAHVPGQAVTAVTIPAEQDRPVALSLGRERVVFVNPGNAVVLGEGAPAVHEFFGFVTRLHRWFALEGVARDRARAVTGAANLVFVLLILSGAYLWLPKFWRASQLRIRVWFKRPYTSSKVRDWTWHHVFGSWLWLPLLLIALTGAVFSYSWANALVYRAFGEEPPQRRGPPGQVPAESAIKPANPERLLAAVRDEAVAWNTMTLKWPVPADDEVSITVDAGNGGQPQRQVRVTVNARTGEIVGSEGFADLSPARRARTVIRRLHTGEVFGATGQAIAGLASFAGIILAWTGLALAWRRLVRPMLARWSRSRLAGEAEG
jgi:uncharacterized iron-regulated membrane protein